MINEAFGWVWFVLGMLSGAWLGMGFAGESFLGGYGSWRRRLLRLGHISFFGLGVINILFACALPRVALPAPWPVAASWALVVGGVSMPVCCALAAWRPRARHGFVVPVGALLGGASVTALGLCVGAVS